MTLLDKTSIVLTPTAYSDGSLNTVIPPYQILPTELVTNGDFSNGTTSWTLDNASNGSISVVNGKLEIVSNGGAGYPVVKQGISTSIGKKYSVTFSVTNNTTGFWFRISQFQSHLSGDTTFYANDKTSSINFKGEFTAISTTSYLKIFAEQNDAGSFKIDNISIKEIQEADFNFSRGSSATRVNEQGLIESIASNLPRIDFTDGTGSLLLEPSRQNKITYSIPNSNWSIENGASITENYSVSPDGSQNASRVQIPLGSLARIYSQFTVDANEDSISFYIKSNTGSNFNIAFYLRDAGFGTVRYINTNLEVTNEWQRVKIENQDLSAASVQVMVLFYNTASSGDTWDFSLWGVQAEGGSYATSYIVSNSGSATTRSADVANNSGNADLFNDSEGVLYAEIAKDTTSVDGGVAISDSSYTNRVLFYFDTSGNIRAYVYSSGVQANIITSGLDYTQNNKLALKYSATSTKFFVNGFQVGSTDTSSTMPVGLSELAFDDGGGGSDFYGKVKELAVFKEALTDAELQQLTS